MEKNIESSDSDEDALDWSLKKRKTLMKHNSTPTHESAKNFASNMQDQIQKYKNLKQISDSIRTVSIKRLKLADKRRKKRLLKKVMKIPFIKELVEEGNHGQKSLTTEKDKEKDWNSVKPFLHVNSHLQGPMPCVAREPKTELESSIDDAIENGDFEKAELLSDNLANRQFAGKICKAYAARRYQDKLEVQKEEEKANRLKKIRWTFEAKERWQMKGNM